MRKRREVDESLVLELNAHRGEIGRSLTVLLALIGFGLSAYLTYLELFTIHAVCQWCVASAALMTCLAVLSIVRLLR